MSRMTLLLLFAFLALAFLYTAPALARLAGGGSIELVTVSSAGEQAQGESGYPSGSSPFSMNPVVAISYDGSLVAFPSSADNLVLTDTINYQDIFVRNRTEETTEIITLDNNGNQPPGSSFGNAHGFSEDNRYVVFTYQDAGIVADDDDIDDVYVRDLQTGSVERISDSPAGESGNGNSGHPTISGDGNVIVFISQASNILGDSIGGHHLIAVNRVTDVRVRVSAGINGEPGNNSSGWATLSHDGNLVAFRSEASNLVLSDTNNQVDIFLRDMTANNTVLVSRGQDGSANGESDNPYITPNGAYVLFTSNADIAADAQCGGRQVYVYKVADSTIELVSTTEQGECPNNIGVGVFGCGISADGRYVVFSSAADNFVAGDTNLRPDIFVKDRVTGAVEWISQGYDGTPANGDSERCGISSDGRSIAFISEASNLIASDLGSFRDYFVYDRDVLITPTNTATPTSSPTSTPLPPSSPTPTSTATPTISPTSTVLPTSSPSSTATTTPTTTERILYLPLIRHDISNLR